MIFIVIVILYFVLFPIGYSCMRWRDKVREIKHRDGDDTSFSVSVGCPPFAIVYGLTEVFLTKKGILKPYEEEKNEGYW